MPITNATLAQQISDLVAYWRTRDTEYAEWVSGAADGGPYSDGRFPLTDYLLNTQYVKSPAALQASVDGPVASALVYRDAAQGHATAASAAQTAAVAARDLALSYQTGAQAAQTLAESAKTYAQAAEANAQTYKNAAAASASAAAADALTADADATAAAASAAAALASELAAAASAAAAATFDPASYVPKTGGTFTGDLEVAQLYVTNTWAEVAGAGYAGFGLKDTTAIANEKWWGIESVAGKFYLAAWGDTTGVKNALEFDRTGLTLTTMVYGNATDNPTHTFYGAANFVTSLAVNGTAVSLSGHTHSYLPLSGGVLTGLTQIHRDTDSDTAYMFELRQGEGTAVRNIGLLFHQANRWWYRLHARTSGFHLVNGADDNIYTDLYARGIAIGDSSGYPYLWKASNGYSLRVSTSQGYVDIGPQNSSYCHFHTDRPAFYFGQPVELANGFYDYTTGSGVNGAGSHQAFTQSGYQIVMKDLGAIAPYTAADRIIMQIQGGNFQIYSHDDSANNWYLPFSANINSGLVTIHGNQFDAGNNYFYAAAWIRLPVSSGLYTQNNEYFYPRNGDGWNIRGGNAGASNNYIVMQSSEGTARAYINWTSATASLYCYGSGASISVSAYGSYGSAHVAGSKNGYCGISMASAANNPNWMWEVGATMRGGVHSEDLGVWALYYNYGNGSHHWYVGSGMYQIPYVTWSSNGAPTSAQFSRGTAAPSGGANGDVYFQYT